MDNLLDEIGLADQIGLDVLGGGEHQRSEFLIPSVVILAAVATLPKNILLKRVP